MGGGNVDPPIGLLGTVESAESPPRLKGDDAREEVLSCKRCNLLFTPVNPLRSIRVALVSGRSGVRPTAVVGSYPGGA